MIRLFIALDIPLEIKNNIFYHINKIIPGNVFKWEKADKIHLTLKFIGNFKEELVSELISSLNFISEFNQFNCSTGNFGFFYRNRKPSIFYLDLIIDERIQVLVKRIEDELTKFGVPPETREFKAHLTLLRLKGWEDVSLLQRVIKSGIPQQNFPGENIVLYKSELNRSGSVYTAINNYKLKRSIL